MSVYEELMKEEKQWEPDPRQTKAMRDYIRDVKTKMDKEKAEKVKAAAKPASTDVAHTKYEGPSLREKLARLKEEEYTPTYRPPQSNVRKEIKGSVKSSGWFKRTGKSGQTKLARVRPHEDPTSLSKRHTRAVSHATSPQGTLTVAHTEYEGPSLREKLEKVRRGVRAGATGSVTGGYLSVAGEKGTGRKVVGSWAQEKHRKPGSKVDPPITYADK